MNPFVLWITSLAIVLSCALRLPAQERVYFGLLHAHTMYSDGSGTPAEAYKMAKEAGLNFFAVTPHNHAAAESGAKDRQDGVLIANDHSLYNSEDLLQIRREWKEDGVPMTEMIESVSVIRAAREATDNSFIALYGQEFSTISVSNHVNVLDYDEVLTTKNGEFAELYRTLDQKVAAGARMPIVQLNHPDVHNDLFYGGTNEKSKRQMRNDYGIDDGDLGPEFSRLAQVSNRYVALIEMLTGPAMKKGRPNAYRYDALENDFYFYLVQGFRISPTAGQDNHYRTWGTVTDARTGVVCDTLTKEALVGALRGRRTFATEDKNLELIFRINGTLMGGNVALDPEEELTLTAEIKDGDEPMSDYDVDLFYGDVKPSHRDQAREWKIVDGFQESRESQGNATVTFNGYTVSGRPEFFFVRIKQSDSDRAWSAPVWINYSQDIGSPVPMFVWSTRPSARVYHTMDCEWAGKISDENRRSGPVPPDGRRPHSCVHASANAPGH